MTNSALLRSLLLEEIKSYPLLTPQDVFKFLYQGAFGCEHLIASPDTVEARIKEECEAIAHPENKISPLSSQYVRLYLGAVKQGLSPKTLAALFIASAKKETDGKAALEEGLAVAVDLVKEGKAPFSCETFTAALQAWRQEGYPALRHSEAYRSAYIPAYRVIEKRYVLYLPLLARLDTMLKKGSVRLAIEGGSAAGKTTISALLAKIYGATVFHMDDFFLRPEQRTAARLAEAGGNVDRERVLSEILLPLSMGESSITYSPFSCQEQRLLPPVTVKPSRLTVIEGAYSMHPLLQSYYDFSVLMHISPALQKKRIQKRNAPQLAERFFAEWIPMEEKYRAAFSIQEQCSLVISVEE